MFQSSTAPGRTFDEVEYKNHLRSDWHRYNLRRKVAGLSMVSEEEYNAKVEAQRLASIESNSIKQDSHVKPSKREQHRAKKKSGQGIAEVKAGAVTKDSVAAYRRRTEKEDPVAVEEEDIEEEEEGEIVTAEARAVDSWFDSKKFDACSRAVEYMRKQYGLYIPEAGYLIDIEKLSLYLCTKVKEHRVCLFCNRQFRSFRACQQHMIDKSHCKIAYETDEALEELADFYDFSSSYDQYEIADDLGLDEEEDEDEWVDVDPDEDDDVTETTATLDPEIKRRPLPKITVMDSGELRVRLAGKEKVVGVRWLKRYYKQNYRLEDERPATLAVRGEQTERLIALYKDAGLPVRNQQVGFFARGLALQLNKRAIGGAMRRDQHAQVKNKMQNMGLHSGRSKRNKGNKIIKNKTAGKNMGEGTGVHG